ncbi:MAG: hypothetical protein Q7K98_07085 [Candidatus Omnitrophota bacterium]|nr:hypothetical protein [Candidatus Omnitrophota bacterium]
MGRYLLIILTLAAVFGFTPPSYADRRSYVWTYEYMTLPKGMAEIEYYLTTQVPDTAKSNVNTWKHWVELEYGITDHWDVAMYQMWRQKNTASSSTFEYDGFKLRTRYRFGEKGKYLVDPELYFEYIREGDFSKPNVGELKLILGKEIGNFNVSYNQILKRNLEKEGKADHEYAVGVNYKFLPAFKLGVESKGSYNGREYAVGPTLSWGNRIFWVSLGAAFGLNARTDDLETRMIVGVPF